MSDYHSKLDELIIAAFKEDIGEGDHSTLACIPEGVRGYAVLKIKEDGILAGVDVAARIFELKDNTSVFERYKNDGETMKSGEIAFEVEATVHAILGAERLVLNSMQRMSGIAGLTKKYSDKLKGYKTKILDTRKTTPNFRLLEKEAVRIGGGFNHRMGLYDMIMLKDNHIDFAGGIEKAIERASDYVKNVKPGLKIEIETRSLDELKHVISFGKVDRIMLDNFSPKQIKEALKLIAGNYETEASGGITLDNITEYADTGVDFVSVGALIHQARSVDLSLKATFRDLKNN
jgi:nicotinate-nucleotide pyrophosphorylase (carboxylating)